MAAAELEAMEGMAVALEAAVGMVAVESEGAAALAAALEDVETMAGADGVVAAASEAMDVALADTVAVALAAVMVDMEGAATVAMVGVDTTTAQLNATLATTATATPASAHMSNKDSARTATPRTMICAEECLTFAFLQRCAGSAKTTPASEATCVRRSIESASRHQ